MLYVKQYNKQALDRSSISTVDYYKRLITVLNDDTLNLSKNLNELLALIQELRGRLAEDKKEIQSDLNKAKEDTKNAHINADNTIKIIQDILDSAEEELETLEDDVEANRECDANYGGCDYEEDCYECVYEEDCYEDCSEGCGEAICEYCDYNAPPPPCTQTGECDESCFFDIGCAETCDYYCEGNFNNECYQCTYDTPNTCSHSGSCSFNGGCTYNGDCTYDGNCYYSGACGHSGACAHSGYCDHCDDHIECNYDECGQTCAYDPDCNQNLICQESGCDECAEGDCSECYLECWEDCGDFDCGECHEGCYEE